MRDDTTGHQYDVAAGRVRPGMTVIDGYPPNFSRHPRRPKHLANKDGTPARRRPASGPAGPHEGDAQ